MKTNFYERDVSGDIKYYESLLRFGKKVIFNDKLISLIGNNQAYHLLPLLSNINLKDSNGKDVFYYAILNHLSDKNSALGDDIYGIKLLKFFIDKGFIFSNNTFYNKSIFSFLLKKYDTTLNILNKNSAYRKVFEEKNKTAIINFQESLSFYFKSGFNVEKVEILEQFLNSKNNDNTWWYWLKSEGLNRTEILNIDFEEGNILHYYANYLKKNRCYIFGFFVFYDEYPYYFNIGGKVNTSYIIDSNFVFNDNEKNSYLSILNSFEDEDLFHKKMIEKNNKNECPLGLISEIIDDYEKNYMNVRLNKKLNSEKNNEKHKFILSKI